MYKEKNTIIYINALWVKSYFGFKELFTCKSENKESVFHLEITLWCAKS